MEIGQVVLGSTLNSSRNSTVRRRKGKAIILPNAPNASFQPCQIWLKCKQSLGQKFYTSLKGT